MARGEIAREGDRDGGEQLGPARSAQVTCHEGGKGHDEPHREGGQHADGCRGEPEQGHRRGGEQRRERRLVGIAEGRVAPCDDEVELVAVEAVGARTASNPATVKPATRSTGQRATSEEDRRFGFVVLSGLTIGLFPYPLPSRC